MDRLHKHNQDLALFVGIEMEGPHQGEKTLFVKGLVPVADILAAYLAKHCQRIYFGAGMMSRFSHATVNTFLKGGFSCTVEGLDAAELGQLPDLENLTIHYSVYVKDVRENNKTQQVTPLHFMNAKVAYKVDTGKSCLFFDTPPVAINAFDGYPSDEIVYYEEIR